jgi:hypothetical protein
LKEALSGHDTPDDISFVVVAFGKEDLGMAIGMVAHKSALINISVFLGEDPLSFPRIEMKLPFVGLIFLGSAISVIEEYALAMKFTLEELSLVDSSIGPLFDAVSSYLAVIKLTSVARPIPHYER